MSRKKGSSGRIQKGEEWREEYGMLKRKIESSGSILRSEKEKRATRGGGGQRGERSTDDLGCLPFYELVVSLP